MNETWLPIPGWEGLYEVSDHGRVRSLSRVITYRTGTQVVREGRVLKPLPMPKGHVRVALSRPGFWRKYLVHRLVLLAFVGPPKPGQIGLHSNDIGSDNRLENLRWGSRADNVQDAIDNGLMPHFNKSHCKRGHAMDRTNTYVHRGRNHCRECRRASDRRRAQRV